MVFIGFAIATLVYGPGEQILIKEDYNFLNRIIKINNMFLEENHNINASNL